MRQAMSHPKGDATWGVGGRGRGGGWAGLGVGRWAGRLAGGPGGRPVDRLAGWLVGRLDLSADGDDAADDDASRGS